MGAWERLPAADNTDAKNPCQAGLEFPPRMREKAATRSGVAESDERRP